MLMRFKTILTSPKRIGEFMNDRVLFALLYILALSAIIIVPSIITVAKSKGVKESSVYGIRHTLVENKEEMPSGGIIDGVFKIEEKNLNSGFFIGKTAIILGDVEVSPTMLAYSGSEYMVKLCEDRIDLYYLFAKFDSFTYEEVGLKNLDFSFIANNEDEGFKMLENAYVKIVNDTQGFWKPMRVLFNWLTLFLGTLLLALLLALVGKIFRKMPYKKLYVIALYSLTILALFDIFNYLFNLSFLYYIGAFLSSIYFLLALRNINTTIEEE